MNKIVTHFAATAVLIFSLTGCIKNRKPDEEIKSNVPVPLSNGADHSIPSIALNPLSKDASEEIKALLRASELHSVESIGWICPNIVVVTLGVIPGSPVMRGVRIFQRTKGSWHLIESVNYAG